MMRMPIPKAIRDVLNDDPFMRDCILQFDLSEHPCDGRIEWQHFFVYGGKRQSELYGILPLCHYHHIHQAEIIPQQEAAMIERIKHFKAVEEFRTKYPKSTLLTI